MQDIATAPPHHQNPATKAAAFYVDSPYEDAALIHVQAIQADLLISNAQLIYHQDPELNYAPAKANIIAAYRIQRDNQAAAERLTRSPQRNPIKTRAFQMHNQVARQAMASADQLFTPGPGNFRTASRDSRLLSLSALANASAANGAVELAVEFIEQYPAHSPEAIAFLYAANHVCERARQSLAAEHPVASQDSESRDAHQRLANTYTAIISLATRFFNAITLRVSPTIAAIPSLETTVARAAFLPGSYTYGIATATDHQAVSWVHFSFRGRRYALTPQDPYPNDYPAHLAIIQADSVLQLLRKHPDDRATHQVRALRAAALAGIHRVAPHDAREFVNAARRHHLDNEQFTRLSDALSLKDRDAAARLFSEAECAPEPTHHQAEQIATAVSAAGLGPARAYRLRRFTVAANDRDPRSDPNAKAPTTRQVERLVAAMSESHIPANAQRRALDALLQRPHHPDEADPATPTDEPHSPLPALDSTLPDDCPCIYCRNYPSQQLHDKVFWLIAAATDLQQAFWLRHSSTVMDSLKSHSAAHSALASARDSVRHALALEQRINRFPEHPTGHELHATLQSALGVIDPDVADAAQPFDPAVVDYFDHLYTYLSTAASIRYCDRIAQQTRDPSSLDRIASVAKHLNTAAYYQMQRLPSLPQSASSADRRAQRYLLEHSSRAKTLLRSSLRRHIALFESRTTTRVTSSIRSCQRIMKVCRQAPLPPGDYQASIVLSHDDRHPNGFVKFHAGDHIMIQAIGEPYPEHVGQEMARAHLTRYSAQLEEYQSANPDCSSDSRINRASQCVLVMSRLIESNTHNLSSESLNRLIDSAQRDGFSDDQIHRILCSFADDNLDAAQAITRRTSHHRHSRLADPKQAAAIMTAAGQSGISPHLQAELATSLSIPPDRYPHTENPLPAKAVKALARTALRLGADHAAITRLRALANPL